MCKVYTGYGGVSEIEHGLCACTVDNPFAKARGLSDYYYYRRTNHALSLTWCLVEAFIRSKRNSEAILYSENALLLIDMVKKMAFSRLFKT